MKKVLSLFLVLVLWVCVLSGCEKAREHVSQTADGKILLTVGNWPDPIKTPESYAYYMQMKADFEILNPDIHIEPDPWCYDVESFIPKAEGETLPILYNTFMTEANMIIDAGYAADITDAMKKYGYFGMLDEYIKDTISRDGSMYLIPVSVYTMGLAVNLDLMRQAGLVNPDGSPKAPETFHELREMAKKIKEKTGKAGFVFPTTGNGGGWNFTNLAWSFGGTFMEKTEDGWIATYGSDEVAEALKFLMDMMWEDNTLPVNTLISNDDTSRMVATGEAAMYLAHPGQLNTMVNMYKMDVNDVGFVKIPAGPKRRVALLGGGYNVISSWATPEQIEAAFRWLDFCGNVPTFELADEKKVRMEESFTMTRDTGTGVIGIIDQPIWDVNESTRKYKLELIQKYKNIDEKNIASYNDKSGVEYQAEEPIKAQSLYSMLDSCIQEVLTNKNADPKEILMQSAAEFQKNYLDGVN